MTTLPMDSTEREAKRRALLEAVARLRGTLEAHIEESEAEGKLAQASVDACQEAGLYGLKLPAVLGGVEAAPRSTSSSATMRMRSTPRGYWGSLARRDHLYTAPPHAAVRDHAGRSRR